ncbi:hypothetical protein KGQ27_02235 [Patescibacteria group bacterium]|nr:hypothetical protein [Patescibacteria group bacterium]MDE1946263.1 hypothetical protein [Patescibacteria group bacterium]
MENLKSQVSDINTKIRDFVNDSTIKKTNIFAKKHDGDWNQFCAALDTIGDTCLAVEGFQRDQSDFVKNPYLTTYGILQALFIQQDSVNYLKTALFGKDKKIDWSSNKYSELAKIRQLRNETIGHPVKTEKKRGKSKYMDGEVSSCMIDRSSLSKEGFSYMLWMSSGTETKHVKFSDVLNAQNQNLSAELEAILKELQKEEKEHKVKFKGEKLADILNARSLYEINLIYGVHWDDHLAWPSFDHYHERYKKIRAGLESRYGKFGTILRIPGTEEVVKKLDYVFSKIEGFKISRKFDDYEFEVYVDALDAGLKELKTHLEEIDKEFEI